MELDADTAAFLAAIEAAHLPGLSEGSVAEARRNYAEATKPPGDPIELVEDRVVPGVDGNVPVRVYAPSCQPDLPVVAFFHGGGWVLGSVDGHDALARRLAVRSGAMVVSVDYRLAPEHPFPTPLEDCWAVTEWLSRHAASWGGDRSRVAVCGDSAGATLAAGVALRARDHRLPLAFQALIYPCLDDRQASYPSMTDNADGYFLTAKDMAWFWDQFVPTEHRSDPYAVPARAESLAGVAPALIQTAEFDPLRDEGEAYGRRLAADGVETTVTRYPGVVHGFATRWHVMGRAETAHDEMAAALKSAFAG